MGGLHVPLYFSNHQERKNKMHPLFSLALLSSHITLKRTNS